MSLETTLAGWTAPSSATEQEKQERTERMIRQAVNSPAAMTQMSRSVYAKGSYPNNTNVRTDSDVDIAVQCHEVIYWEEEAAGAHPHSPPYQGPWTPRLLRATVLNALQQGFPGDVDNSGSIAIKVRSSGSRVNADVTPCFDYRYHFQYGGYRDGTRIFTTSNQALENYPVQHLEKGRAKNVRTLNKFKQAVRIFKRLENEMLDDGYHREVKSFFLECLVYNCPDNLFIRSSWTSLVSGLLVHIWEGLQGDIEPASSSGRWMLVNECEYLFPNQDWTRRDGREFAYAAWNYLGLGD